jgi:conjugal transfer mating pair stabilization protein TraG
MLAPLTAQAQVTPVVHKYRMQCSVNNCFYFDEIVKVNLDCLRADGPNKTVCQAAALQALEVERSNIQRAASEAQMLKFAGAFANQMMALIIGIGPILVMFMMFSGVNATKSIYMAAHVITWPFLVLNVGAEIINGMIYIHVANFLASIANGGSVAGVMSPGGYVTHSVAMEAYREFSLQIGMASHIMSSLPVLLSMIFAMGASSASVAVASKMAPSDSSVAPATTPNVQDNTPLFRNSTMANIQQMDGGNIVKSTGAANLVEQTAKYGELSKQVVASNAQERAKQRTISEAENFTNGVMKNDSKRDSTSWGVDKATSDRISDSARDIYSHSKDERLAQTVATSKSTGTTTSIEAGVVGKLGFGITGFSGGVEASVHTDIASNATNSKNASEEAQRAEAIHKSKAMEQAISKEIATTNRSGENHEKSKSLEKMLQAQKLYTESLSKTETEKESSSQSNQDAQSLVAYSQNLGTSNIIAAANSTPGYKKFLAQEGRNFSLNPAAAKKIDQVQEFMQSSGALEKINASPDAKNAVVRHMAAVRLATDKDATKEERQLGVDYLTQQGLAMSGIQQKFQSPAPVVINQIQDPQNKTGVSGQGQLLGPAVVPAVKPAAAPAVKTSGTVVQQPNAAVLAAILPKVDGDGKGLQRVADMFTDAKRSHLAPGDPTGTVALAALTVAGSIASLDGSGNPMTETKGAKGNK